MMQNRKKKGLSHICAACINYVEGHLLVRAGSIFLVVKKKKNEKMAKS